MRWQKFLSNFCKSTIIKAFAFSSIYRFDRNCLKERKDFIADKVSLQTWTIAVLRYEFIIHEFWVFSSWNKQRLNKNILSWCNQTPSVCCSSDMVLMWLALLETSSSPQKKMCSDMTTKYRWSILTVSCECIVVPTFLWESLPCWAYSEHTLSVQKWKEVSFWFYGFADVKSY